MISVMKENTTNDNNNNNNTATTITKPSIESKPEILEETSKSLVKTGEVKFAESRNKISASSRVEFNEDEDDDDDDDSSSDDENDSKNKPNQQKNNFMRSNDNENDDSSDDDSEFDEARKLFSATKSTMRKIHSAAAAAGVTVSSVVNPRSHKTPSEPNIKPPPHLQLIGSINKSNSRSSTSVMVD